MGSLQAPRKIAGICYLEGMKHIATVAFVMIALGLTGILRVLGYAIPMQAQS